MPSNHNRLRVPSFIREKSVNYHPCSLMTHMIGGEEHCAFVTNPAQIGQLLFPMLSRQAELWPTQSHDHNSHFDYELEMISLCRPTFNLIDDNIKST